VAWQLVFTEQYNGRAARFLRRHPSAKVLRSPAADPHHPSLRPHASKGKWSRQHSVSISFSCRITREWLITKSEIVPINVGSHGEVY
jgi:mRNA-degrading endonuclease YafQ of YafQ-DinJ toxin-antitoxin module